MIYDTTNPLYCQFTVGDFAIKNYKDLYIFTISFSFMNCYN